VRSWNWRDLRRGCLIGLIAGTGYVLAYRIILFLALDSPYYEGLVSLGWLIAVPVPAFLLWYFNRIVQRIDEEAARERAAAEEQQQQQQAEQENEAAQDASAEQPPEAEE
jgi:hypothetical protein